MCSILPLQKERENGFFHHIIKSINLDYSRVEATPPHPNINGCEAQRMQFGWLGRVGSYLPQILCNEATSHPPYYKGGLARRVKDAANKILSSFECKFGSRFYE